MVMFKRAMMRAITAMGPHELPVPTMSIPGTSQTATPTATKIAIVRKMNCMAKLRFPCGHHLQ